MTRRRLLLLASLPLAVAATVGVLALLPPRSNVTEAMARKSVWQLLNKIDDPMLSTLRNFAAAIGVPMSEIFPADKKSRSK